MKKLSVLFLSLVFMVMPARVCAQGYPVIDVANLVQSIEQVYQYYQQIQNTIEQVQNTYKRIEQAAQSMMAMNWDDLKNLGDNFNGMSSNPFEAITGVRNSAQDIVKAVNKNMNKVNNLQDSLTRESISFGGMKVSVADLVGAGDPNKTVTGFTKNAWHHTLDTGEAAIAGYVGKLTYKEREAIMRKYGMSPRNYASIEYANDSMSRLVQQANILSTEQAQKELMTEIEADANALKMAMENTPEGSTYAGIQMLNSSVAQLVRQIGNLHLTLNRTMGLVSSNIATTKAEEAIALQREAEEKRENAKNLSGGGNSAVFSVF